MLRYGLLIGAGAAIAYLIAAAAGVDHPGWAPAACLLVARPAVGLLETRAVGRLIAVTAGALLAAYLVHAPVAHAVFAAVVALTVTAAAATRGSRWYITSAYTTLLVFLMILLPDPGEAAQKVNERLVETVIGVGLALVFGVLLPQALARRAR